MRLIPIFPFNAVNYAFGMTSVRAYITATALGIVPGTIAFVALGSSLRDPGSPAFLIALGAVAALVVIGSVAGRVLRSGRPSGGEPVA